MGVEIAVGGMIEIGNEIQEIRREFRDFTGRFKGQSPIIRKNVVSFVADSAAKTYSFVDIGGPKAGHTWDIRRYKIGALDPWATPQGTILPIITSENFFANTSTEPGAFGHEVDVTATIPAQGNWSRDQVTLRPGEHFVFVFKGLANAQALRISYQVVDYIETDIKAYEIAP